MGNRRNTWRESFAALGESLIEVLRAELAVIGEAWKGSLRHLGIALGLFAVAGYVALVCLPTLVILALVAGMVALGMPLWGAALVVIALVVTFVAVVVALAKKRLHERFENPVATVKDRVADHTAWWNERVLNGHDTASLEEDNSTEGARSGADDAEQGYPRQDDPGDRPIGEKPPGS